MQRHERFELLEYQHKELMDELNEFMVCAKTHLFNIPVNKPKPTVGEMDSLMFRILAVLRKDSRPMRR